MIPSIETAGLKKMIRDIHAYSDADDEDVEEQLDTVCVEIDKLASMYEEREQ